MSRRNPENRKYKGGAGRALLVFLLAALILVLSWIVPYIFDLFSTIQTLFSL